METKEMNESKKTKTRKHPILNVYILGPIISMILGYLFSQLFGGIVGGVLERIFGNEYQFILIFAVIGGFLTLLIHKRWFKGEYKGSFARINPGDKKLITLIVIIILFDVIIDIADVALIYGMTFASFEGVATALMAGVSEEVGFRALPISVAMRRVEDKHKIAIAVIISAVSFSLVHAANVFLGADPVATGVQLVSSASIGICYASLYLRTGNILFPIIGHFLHDYFGLCAIGVDQGGTMGAMPISDIVVSIIQSVIFVVLGILLLKGHKEDINKVWDERWSRT